MRNKRVCIEVLLKLNNIPTAGKTAIIRQVLRLSRPHTEPEMVEFQKVHVEVQKIPPVLWLKTFIRKGQRQALADDFSP